MSLSSSLFKTCPFEIFEHGSLDLTLPDDLSVLLLVMYLAARC